MTLDTIFILVSWTPTKYIRQLKCGKLVVYGKCFLQNTLDVDFGDASDPRTLVVKRWSLLSDSHEAGFQFSSYVPIVKYIL